MAIILITGGSRSGKSGFAQKMANIRSKGNAAKLLVILFYTPLALLLFADAATLKYGEVRDDSKLPGLANGPCAIAYFKLGIDVSGVGPDRVRRNHQCFCNLRVGEAAPHQAQNLFLPPGQGFWQRFTTVSRGRTEGSQQC